MGSVKNLSIIKPVSIDKLGEGIFYFTDDYSVFDYGKMPDIIPEKGEALCRMAAYNFEQLKKLGIDSHFIELISGKEMKVKIVRVLNPQQHDLSKEKGNYLVPLEIMFRNSLPAGSSVFKRLENGQTTLEQLGLKKMPVPGKKLDEPLLDVSTKLEERDRYLTWHEAQKISGLNDEEFADLKKRTLKINDFLTKKAEKIGLEHADGKVEFGLTPERKLILVDVCGTLDENRFLFNGVHLSKQVLRDYYNKTPWKEEYLRIGKQVVPPKLPEKVIELVSNMYKSVTEAWIGEEIWNAPSIEDIVIEYTELLEKI